MQSFITFINSWFLHLDIHVSTLVATHGNWIYLILFFVIFVETGFVIMPFLPGDSLLFVAGSLSASGSLDPWLLFILLTISAVTGDAINFVIGSVTRKKTVDIQRIAFLNQAYLTRTHNFFAQHGGKTVVLARFVPIVRTLAPFVAALGNMPPRIFFTYNVLGAALWVGLLIACGNLFGAIPWVSKNLTIVVLGIVFLSILPATIGWVRSRHSLNR